MQTSIILAVVFIIGYIAGHNRATITHRKQLNSLKLKLLDINSNGGT